MRRIRRAFRGRDTGAALMSAIASKAVTRCTLRGGAGDGHVVELRGHPIAIELPVMTAWSHIDFLRYTPSWPWPVEATTYGVRSQMEPT
jgi:hypothetical protein